LVAAATTAVVVAAAATISDNTLRASESWAKKQEPIVRKSLEGVGVKIKIDLVYYETFILN